MPFVAGIRSITSGGMIGRVLKVSDTSDEIEVELADNLKVRIVKGTISDVRSKGEPVKDAAVSVAMIDKRRAPKGAPPSRISSAVRCADVI